MALSMLYFVQEDYKQVILYISKSSSSHQFNLKSFELYQVRRIPIQKILTRKIYSILYSYRAITIIKTCFMISLRKSFFFLPVKTIYLEGRERMEECFPSNKGVKTDDSFLVLIQAFEFCTSGLNFYKRISNTEEEKMKFFTDLLFAIKKKL